MAPLDQPAFDPRDAREFLNPYLSARRQWVCKWLAERVPHSGMPPLYKKGAPPHIFVASNNGQKAMFTELTGYTQEGLVKKWTEEGFRATTKEEREGNDLKYKGKAFVRVTGVGPGTTSCEALVNKLFQKITANGFGTRPATGAQATSFNLGGLGKNGMAPATARGWHWFSERTAKVHPQPGDFFQVGVPQRTPGQWGFRHVGVITGYVEGDNPSWETVEAGQGGPAAGYDYILRKPWRAVTPVDPKDTGKVVMGWLNIDEYFGDKPG